MASSVSNKLEELSFGTAVYLDIIEQTNSFLIHIIIINVKPELNGLTLIGSFCSSTLSVFFRRHLNKSSSFAKY